MLRSPSILTGYPITLVVMYESKSLKILLKIDYCSVVIPPWIRLALILPIYPSRIPTSDSNL